MSKKRDTAPLPERIAEDVPPTPLALGPGDPDPRLKAKTAPAEVPAALGPGDADPRRRFKAAGNPAMPPMRPGEKVPDADDDFVFRTVRAHGPGEVPFTLIPRVPKKPTKE